MVSRRDIQLVLSFAGLAIILIGVVIAYQAYVNASVEFSGLDVNQSLSKSLEILTVVGFKGVFLGIMIWSGSILLSNGLKHWPCESSGGEGKANE